MAGKRAAFRAGRDAEAVLENLELLTGQRGNGLDRALTLRDLTNLGVVGVTRTRRGGYVAKPLVTPPPQEKDTPVSPPWPFGGAGHGRVWCHHALLGPAGLCRACPL